MKIRDEIDFAARQKRISVQKKLEDDARLLTSVNKIVKKIINSKENNLGELIPPCKLSTEQVSGWWNYNHNGLPKELHFLLKLVKDGTTPVFCNISLLIEPSAPTVYVPVFYPQEAMHSAQLLSSLLLSADDNLNTDSLSDFFIKFSHALSNISYSVKINDVPIQGYLAEAHHSRKLMYIEDVTDIPPSEKVESVARYDERYLGMASVMYIPLEYNSELSPRKIGEQSYSRAVLMLWSPVPDFLDNSILEQKEHITKIFSEKLSWLGNIIHTMDTAFHENATRHISFLRTLSTLSRHLHPIDAEAFNSIFLSATHNLHDIVKLILKGEEEEKRWVRIDEFIKKFILTEDGLNNFLTGLGYDENELILEFENKAGEEYTHSVKGINSIINYLNSIVIMSRLRLSMKNAMTIATSPFDNMGLVRNTGERKYMDKFVKCKVILSDYYLSVRFYQVPTGDALKRLTEGDEGFRRYYALRRGISVPANRPGSHGLGVSLFSPLSSFTKVSRKLYLPPNGNELFDEVSFPIKQISQ